MPRRREGTAIPHDGHWDVRITLNDGSRPVICLRDEPEGRSKALARMRARSLTELARTGNAYLPGGSVLAEQGGSSLSAEDWFDAWMKARVARGLTSTKDNRSHYEHHIKPALPKHVRDWTAEDVRALVRALDAKVQAGELSWKAARNVWGTASKMAADAVKSKLDSLRVRTTNPCADVEGPDRGEKRAKQFLYPSEFLQFVSCEDVPLSWRRAVAQAVYLFVRDGEHRALQCADVDRAHGVVNVTKARDRRTNRIKATKTKRARRFNVEPNLLPLLAATHSEAPSAPLCELPPEHNISRGLKLWLRKAGVRRKELHETTRTSKGITWHDLRATGITWMAIRGDEPLRIMSCAGHENFATTQTYIRAAEAIRDGFGDVFPPLPKSLLGRSALAAVTPINRDSSAETSEAGPRIAKGRLIVAERAGFEPAAGF